MIDWTLGESAHATLLALARRILRGHGYPPILHVAGKSDEVTAQITQAVTVFEEISVEAGTLRPEI
jgi:hypothetical protein